MGWVAPSMAVADGTMINRFAQSSSGNIGKAQVEIYPLDHLLYGCLLVQHCSKPLTEDCGGSSHTPVGRTGGVKSEAFTSLILCRSYANSSLVHARYKYQCFHQAKGYKINNIS